MDSIENLAYVRFSFLLPFFIKGDTYKNFNVKDQFLCKSDFKNIFQYRSDEKDNKCSTRLYY